jgi:hypothetical protein
MNKLSTNGIVRAVLISSFFIALLVGTALFYSVLHNRALARTAVEAGRLLTTAMAIRSYTEDHVRPDLQKLPLDKFYEAIVPAFAAQAVYRRVQASYPGYTYREPTLNPTNLNNRPMPIEVELINRFRADPNLKELQGVREDKDGTVYYLARPIKAQESCMVCHDTPERAPRAMVAKYGANGFGWRLGETVGIQSLTVPAAEELKETGEIAMILGAGLLVLFIAVYFALTSLLDSLVVRPLHALADAADQASTTSDAKVALPQSGAEEIRSIATAIERLRTSLAKAMQRLAGDKSGGKA